MVKKVKASTPKPKKQDPLPDDPLGARYCTYFNHPYRFIFAQTPEPDSRPSWKTENYYLYPRNLWEMHQDPSILLGLRFGSNTRYALIDIDRDSPYHPGNDEQSFKLILHSCEDIGLVRPLIVQSSWSQGIHIYFFLPEPVHSFGIACAIKFALLDQGFHLKDGEIEIFPNVKAYKKDGYSLYKGHRLPWQPNSGSYLLDDDYQILTRDLNRCLDIADTAAQGQDIEELKEAIAAAQLRHKISYSPSGSKRAEKWKKDLEHRNSIGWTAPGQTNELLKDIGVYGRVWLGLSGQALTDYIVTTAVNSKGYREYCSHQNEIELRASDWATAVEKYYSPYCSYPDRNGTYAENFDQVGKSSNNIVPFSTNNLNALRSNEATERIKMAVAHLEATDSLPTSVVARIAAIIATAKELTGVGVSNLTLQKKSNLPLWHPKYYNGSEFLEGRTEQSLRERLTDCAIDSEINSATSSVVSKEESLESLSRLDSDQKLTPSCVVCQDEDQTETLESSFSLDCNQKTYTPSYMKVSLWFFLVLLTAKSSVAPNSSQFLNSQQQSDSTLQPNLTNSFQSDKETELSFNFSSQQNLDLNSQPNHQNINLSYPSQNWSVVDFEHKQSLSISQRGDAANGDGLAPSLAIDAGTSTAAELPVELEKSSVPLFVRVQIKQIEWRNKPKQRPAIVKWAAMTPGVVITDNGPALTEEASQQAENFRLSCKDSPTVIATDPPDWLRLGKKVQLKALGIVEVCRIMGQHLCVRLPSGEIRLIQFWAIAVENSLLAPLDEPPSPGDINPI